MIDLQAVRTILDEADALVTELDGVDMTDHDSTEGGGGKAAREARAKRAQLSKDMILLADRLGLAEALVRNEYHFNRGERDPLAADRD